MIQDMQPCFGHEIENAYKLDIFYFDTSKEYIEPIEDYVISRTKDGRVLSRYADDKWDVSPYSSENSTVVSFGTLKDLSIRQEAKRLLFLYYLFGAGRYDTGISGTTFRHFYNQSIKTIAIYAQEQKMSIKLILESNKNIEDFINKKLLANMSKVPYFKKLLSFLKTRSNTETGINYCQDVKITKYLSKLLREYYDSLEQTEVIPLSIYNNASKQRWKHLDRVEPMLENLFCIISECINNPAFARKNNSKLATTPKKKYGLYGYNYWHNVPSFVEWKEAIKKYGLTKLFHEYEVTSRQEALSFLGSIQVTCRHLIHMYTGMREYEGRYLKQDCYLPRMDGMPPRIQGIETKINGVPTSQKWITMEKLKRVIEILARIGNFIAEHKFPSLKDRPLNIAIAFLRGQKIYRDLDGFDQVLSGTLDNYLELSLSKDGITITREHIEEELSAIDPLRDWTDHKWIEVDEPWQFKSHQYRRSLAVYALGSGLVTVFTLKEQFGHLLKSMSEYYGNGHLAAKRFDGKHNNEHIANYMKKIAAYVETASFIKNTLLSKEQLFGGGGVFYEKHLVAKTPETREQIFRNFKETEKKIKKGQLRYRETAVGGCTSIAPCDKYLFPSMINYCKECEHSIVKISKLESLIERQQKFVLYLQEKEPDSIQHRTEVRNLLDNEAYLKWLRRKIAVSKIEETGV